MQRETNCKKLSRCCAERFGLGVGVPLHAEQKVARLPFQGKGFNSHGWRNRSRDNWLERRRRMQWSGHLALIGTRCKQPFDAVYFSVSDTVTKRECEIQCDA